MAIQFKCSSCGRAIEVDDEFAGREAQCPYCDAVISVPQRSALDEPATPPPPPVQPIAGDEASFTAAPDEPPPPPSDWDAPVAPPGVPAPLRGMRPDEDAGPASLHVGPIEDQRTRSARRLGIASFILGLFALLTFLTVLCVVVALLLQMTRENPEMVSLGPEQAQEFQRRVEQMPGAVWITIGGLLGSLAAVIGLPMGIVSLVRCQRRNALAWTGVVLTGCCVLCVCTNVLLSITQLAT